MIYDHGNGKRILSDLPQPSMTYYDSVNEDLLKSMCKFIRTSLPF